MQTYSILQVYLGSYEITIKALKDSDVYVCCFDNNHEWKSQLQQLNFKTKEEKVRLSDGSNLTLHHKKMLVNELVELTGKYFPSITIFVR